MLKKILFDFSTRRQLQENSKFQIANDDFVFQLDKILS